jgi:hypothetical protein
MQRNGVQYTKGTLITTDIPTKQLIMYLDSQKGNKIVLNDLDDKHVLIDTRYLSWVQENCSKLHEQFVFERRPGEKK